MNPVSYALVAAYVVVAIANWVTRLPGRDRFEGPTKLGAIALLVGVAVTLTPVDDAVRAWFVLALVLSLAGDAFLLAGDRRFVPGLAAFLLAHVAYLVGFLLVDDWRPVGFAVGIASSLALLATVGRRILGAAGALRPAVACYLVTILAMATVAWATLPVVGVVGAVLFVASDSLLGWRMFVIERASPPGRAPAWMPPAIMATYHLAQLLLTLSLVVG